MAGRLVILGLGYCGAAVARAALEAGYQVCGTQRTRAWPAPQGVATVSSEAAEPMISAATHLLATAPPADSQDPFLARYCSVITAAKAIRWIGYLSSTAVYGDRGGGWVTEETLPAPSSARGVARLAAEAEWAEFADSKMVDLFRLSGIYGPGRSAFDQIRAGTARRLIKAGQAFSRIHRDDIVAALLAAMRQERKPGLRIFNLADDLPTPPSAVIEEAARLLGTPPPPVEDFATAQPRLSLMAASFWAENRKVASRRTREVLGIEWRHPTYREGLAAILAEEGGERASQKGEIGEA